MAARKGGRGKTTEKKCKGFSPLKGDWQKRRKRNGEG